MINTGGRTPCVNTAHGGLGSGVSQEVRPGSRDTELVLVWGGVVFIAVVEKQQTPDLS